ncbi:unnamed protein product, partial [Schistosoma curassoni]|uniref:Ovule protein n=1 Tax=Schistosoma curassoni TaxID=6186 RepID=A0A183JD88_9TREM
ITVVRINVSQSSAFFNNSFIFSVSVSFRLARNSALIFSLAVVHVALQSYIRRHLEKV